MNGRASMHKTAINNLVLMESSSSDLFAKLPSNGHAGFYQQLALFRFIRESGGRKIISEIGGNISALADHAYALRDVDSVEHISGLFMIPPLIEAYGSLGQYYAGLVALQKGRLSEAREKLEQVAAFVPPGFRAKVMVAVAGTYYLSGDFHSALPICVEASRIASSIETFDAQTILVSNRNIAIHKSIEGDHRSALSELENLFPRVRQLAQWRPYQYYEFLNSFAIELMEAGRIEEAVNASQIALASPYAFAYPEWLETRDEIMRKRYRASRSLVDFGGRKKQELPPDEEVEIVREHTGPKEPVNLRHMPLPTPNHDSGEKQDNGNKSAVMFVLADWQGKMGNTKPDEEKQPPRRDARDARPRKSKQTEIISRVVDDDTSDSELDAILEFLDKLRSSA